MFNLAYYLYLNEMFVLSKLCKRNLIYPREYFIYNDAILVCMQCLYAILIHIVLVFIVCVFVYSLTCLVVYE